MLLHDPHHDGSPMYVADEAPVGLGTSTTGPVVLGVEPLA
jgi:hypothetical protein